MIQASPDMAKGKIKEETREERRLFPPLCHLSPCKDNINFNSLVEIKIY